MHIYERRSYHMVCSGALFTTTTDHPLGGPKAKIEILLGCMFVDGVFENITYKI